MLSAYSENFRNETDSRHPLKDSRGTLKGSLLRGWQLQLPVIMNVLKKQNVYLHPPRDVRGPHNDMVESSSEE